MNLVDRSLKALARRYPGAFIQLAVGSPPGLAFETIENPEINLPERRLDFVYGLKCGGRNYLLHLEFQLRHEAGLPRRMHAYNALLTLSHRRPVISKLIYVERRNYRRLPSAYVVELAGRPENTFTYEVIRLWDHAEAIASGELREPAPLLVLLDGKRDAEVLARTRDLILGGGDRKWRADALSVAMTLAARRFPRAFVLEFFREEVPILREASIVEDWIREGIEKGRREGLLKGEVRALQGAVLEVLTARFGSLPPGIGRRVAAVERPATLHALLKMSARAASLDAFARRLDDV